MTEPPNATMQVGARAMESGQILFLPLASLMTSATWCLSFPITEVI